MSYYKFEKFTDPKFPIYSSKIRKKGNVVAAHFHSAFELLLIREGTPILTLDAAGIQCAPGDLFFIPSYIVHDLQSGEEICATRGITFESALIDEQACEISFEELFGRGRITELRFREGEPFYSEMRAAFDALFSAYREESPTRRFAVLSALYRVVEVLMKRYVPEGKVDRAYQRLLPAIRYMEENYARSITLQEIGDVLNVCGDHAIRMFKESTKKTPIRYLCDLRLSEAIKLLVDTELSIAEISARCGFSNVNYLSKLFKERLGKSPRAYRAYIRRRKL